MASPFCQHGMGWEQQQNCYKLQLQMTSSARTRHRRILILHLDGCHYNLGQRYWITTKILLFQRTYPLRQQFVWFYIS